MGTVALAIYFGLVAVLSAAGAHRLFLAAVVLVRRRRAAPPPPSPPAVWPTVVVQLPTYEEAFVARRALAAAASLRYPREKLQIQLLDDSRGEARAELAAAAEALGIAVVHRSERTGFKAGALAHGLARTDAELVAIFDADFVPPPDFLERAVAVLAADPGLGLVQARWGHLNAGASRLTRAQALLLDAHFSVEHQGRALLGHAFNFNGTCGVWRRRAIEDAGGWSADTLTEDLDLSYRAQLAGWRFAYVDELEVPGELPESWLAFRAQQARWARGGTETARKLLGRVWRAASWSWARKVEATIHLGANSAYLLMAVLALWLPAVVVLRQRLGPGGDGALWFLDLSMLGVGMGSLVLHYTITLVVRGRRLDGRAFADVVLAVVVGSGLVVSNARAVLRAFGRRRGEFVRTPKRGDVSTAVASARYPSPGALAEAAAEVGLAALHVATIAYALAHGAWGPVPFLAVYAAGLGAMAVQAWREGSSERRSAPRAEASAPEPDAQRLGEGAGT